MISMSNVASILLLPNPASDAETSHALGSINELVGVCCLMACQNNTKNIQMLVIFNPLRNLSLTLATQGTRL